MNQFPFAGGGLSVKGKDDSPNLSPLTIRPTLFTIRDGHCCPGRIFNSPGHCFPTGRRAELRLMRMEVKPAAAGRGRAAGGAQRGGG